MVSTDAIDWKDFVSKTTYNVLMRMLKSHSLTHPTHTYEVNI